MTVQSHLYPPHLINQFCLSFIAPFHTPLGILSPVSLVDSTGERVLRNQT